MGAAGPAARSAHAFAHFIKPHRYAAASGFIFLSRRNPANPLITRQRRDIRPYIFHLRIGSDGLAKIRGHFVYHTADDLFGGHTSY